MFQIRLFYGAEARPLVDPFYERNGRQPCARDEDLFFIAMDDAVLGCVRFCVENDTPMLRTMMVDAVHRRRGIGGLLLREFVGYLDAHQIRDVYCLPYAHLDGFYGAVGFQRIAPEQAPAFLQQRLRSYDPSGKAYLCMRRP
jgi:N-acetylglutamate synthase-like GNAT family acetyltransferase